MGKHGLPITVCDLSNGPYSGSIYINWTDQRNGSDDTDVWLTKSTDGGNTWCAPIRVNNDPPGKQQFFTWMTIDQTNGYLYFVFYDRRNYNNNQTDVYMVVSTDGGYTFTNFKISESPFLPDQSVFFGDYTNITAHDSVIRPIWTRLDDSDLSIWTAIVDPDLISGVEEELFAANVLLNQNRPNPFTNETFISFKLHKSSIISLKVYDFMGREIRTMIDDQRYDYGKYIERFDPEEYNIGSGMYYYVLKSDGMVLKKKMLHVK
ncbi:MAG: T9SS type A sorting domain-containing protein [Bacteroidota bacterium]